MTSTKTGIQQSAPESPPSNLALTLQFLDWLAHQPRSYQQTMDAWQTHCPRFTIWEDAYDLGLVRVRLASGSGALQVELTATGRNFIASQAESASNTSFRKQRGEIGGSCSRPSSG